MDRNAQAGSTSAFEPVTLFVIKKNTSGTVNARQRAPTNRPWRKHDPQIRPGGKHILSTSPQLSTGARVARCDAVSRL